MRKYKDLTFNEKLLIAMAILLIVGILIKWPQVKQGFVKSWKYFGFGKIEQVDK